MGPSGSGKSTLMHILAGLDKPTEGEVAIDGTNIEALSDTELTKLRRRHIGFVFQFFNLLPMLTAEENIVLPLELAGGKVDEGVGRLGDREGRPGRPAQAPPLRALGRAAAARGHRPCARLQAHGRLRGRADRQPRLDDGQEILDLLRESVETLGQTFVMVSHDPQGDGHRRPHALPRRRPDRQGTRQGDGARGRADDGGSEPAVIRVALRGLLGRKLRATLTAVAIILGVAMMSGTFVLTDTIDKAFSTIFDESYAETDVVVSGKGADISFQGHEAEAPPIDESLVAEVNALPDVEMASGSVADETNTKIIGSDGKAINTEGAPSLGFGIDPRPRGRALQPAQPRRRHLGQGDGQVVIDAARPTARATKSATQSRSPRSSRTRTSPDRDREVRRRARSGRRRSPSSTSRPPSGSSTGRARSTSISVAGVEGTTPEQLIEEIQPVLPADAQVRSAQIEAHEDKDDVNEFVSFIQYFLLAFAAIALFVGAFVIFNTLSITVAQRTREFATLRTVGASRRQILWSVIVEALTIGFIASVIGLFAGLGLAIGLNELFKALDLELPTTDTVFALRTVVVSLLVGIGITLLAGIFPAMRADARAADRGGTGRLHAPARTLSSVHAVHRARRHRARGLPPRLLDVPRRARHCRSPALHRRGRPAPVRRRGDDLPAADQAAGRGRRLAGARASRDRPASSPGETPSATRVARQSRRPR